MDPAPRIKQEPGLKTEYLTAAAGLHTNSSAATAAAGASSNAKRLGSFSSPRDLTLTNGRPTKPPDNKKLYKPNLVVARNRNAEVKTASTGPKPKVKVERNKNDRDAKNKKGMLIQTSGIFSDGLAQRSITRASKYDKASSSREPGESMRKPVFAGANTKFDLEDEQKRLKHLYDDEDECVAQLDEKIEKGLKFPVKLESSDYNVKPVEVKVEPMFDRDAEIPNILNAVRSSTDDKSIFLLQLPDALPGKCDTGERQPGNDADRGADTSQPANITAGAEPRYCTMRDLEEGCVGKILRYRSGKTKLLLGDILFDLTLGMDTGFLQELVSINTNPVERSGNIINLSTIKAKLNASPDWEYLFKNST
uniref:Putative dna-directed rna polymerase iii subunit d n=1 Tax=Anopheles triannulatus TaxID=58253 RepID=A0A2M4ATE8_9DIPT